MLPELQGRLPVRVELKALSEEDFYRILTVPTNNLIKQQCALLKTSVDMRPCTQSICSRLIAHRSFLFVSQR